MIAVDAGSGIVRISLGAVLVFAAAAIPDALGVDAFGTVALVVCLAFFLASLPVWLYALARAAGRTAPGDEIAVTNLFFLAGSAPAAVRRLLLGALGVTVVIAAATAKANPSSILVPMLPLGLAGLWGARHGTYPPRPARGASPRRS